MVNISFVISLCFLILISCAPQQPYREAPLTGPAVVLEAKALKQEVPLFFTYRHGGKNINFFVMKTGGRVLSFVDACMRCYPSKRGYRFDEGRIICRHCNVGYPTDEIEHGVGGCFPIRIAGHLKGGKYFIPVLALERMADKF